jgi:hypothetical protein
LDSITARLIALASPSVISDCPKNSGLALLPFVPIFFAMGQVEQSRQFAAACREQLATISAQSDLSAIIARSCEKIEHSRVLLIKLDQILSQGWASVWLCIRDSQSIDAKRRIAIRLIEVLRGAGYECELCPDVEAAFNEFPPHAQKLVDRFGQAQAFEILDAVARKTYH